MAYDLDKIERKIKRDYNKFNPDVDNIDKCFFRPSQLVRNNVNVTFNQLVYALDNPEYTSDLDNLDQDDLDDIGTLSTDISKDISNLSLRVFQDEYVKTIEENLKELATLECKAAHLTYKAYQTTTITNSEPYRIALAYRLIRHFMLYSGLMPDDGMLMSVELDHWIKPRAPRPKNAPNKVQYTIGLTLLHHNYKERIDKYLHPIPLHPMSEEEGDLYHQLILYLISKCKIIESSMNVEALIIAIPYFLNKKVLLNTFPTVLQVVEFEENMFNTFLNVKREQGTLNARDFLCKKYGFSQIEAREIAILSQRYDSISCNYTKDTETNKRIMLNKLDDVAERAKSAFNFTAEMSALKETSTILKLKKITAEDLEDEEIFRHAIDDYLEAEVTDVSDLSEEE